MILMINILELSATAPTTGRNNLLANGLITFRTMVIVFIFVLVAVVHDCNDFFIKLFEDSKCFSDRCEFFSF